MAVDLAVLDARIRTLDPQQPFATALAVQDGVIVAVGSSEQVRDLCGPRTTVFAGAHWHLTPGLNDGHQHLLSGAEVSQGINFDRVATLEQVRDLLRAERRRLGPDAWITGFAFEYAALEGAQYHHDLVDEAAGPGPMLIHTLDLHTGLANASALRIASVTGPREFADGSSIVVDASGTPTGELREMAAVRTVAAAIPEADDAERLRWYAAAIRAQNAVGITGIHQMDGGAKTAEVFSALDEAGLLNLRIRLHQWVDPSDDDDALEAIVRRRDLAGATWTADAVKFMIDGVIDTGTAWLEKPDTRGDGTDPMWPDPGHFRATIARFHDAGFHIATHAIGDRAVREVLDAYAAAGGSAGRHRIEHIETAPPELIARFRRERVSASMQPIHLRWIDPDGKDPWSVRLGGHKCRHAMPSGEIDASGANVVLGSDWPVAPYDPRMGFFTAQRRYAPDVADHRPVGTSRALTGAQTLAGYTVNAERIDGGTGAALRVGAPADFVAWGDDIVEVAPEDVLDLPVHLTVVAGKVAHHRD